MIRIVADLCTGCGLCVEVCPAEDKETPDRKALNMSPLLPLRAEEVKNFDQIKVGDEIVARRYLAIVVSAVKVDAEQAQQAGGYSGRELAARFGVTGFPTLVLLDGEGRVLARTSGYQDSRGLLRWLDGAAGRSGACPP